MGIFSKVSGLNKLVDHYPAIKDPDGISQTKQTLKIGVVRYRRCVTVSIERDALFLLVSPPLGRKSKIMIPWHEIRQVSRTSLYGRQGVQMSIGDPVVGEITIYRDLFEQLRGNLGEMAQLVKASVR